MKVVVLLLALCVTALAEAPPAASPAGEAAAAAAPAAAPGAPDAAGVPLPPAPGAAPAANPLEPTGGAPSGEELPSNASPDPLGLGATPPEMAGDASTPNTLPPFDVVTGNSVVSPPISAVTQDSMKLGVDKRIQQTDDLLNRMVWQLNRETSWANSVHDIIQNYQYKYTKVLSNIKKHSGSIKKMRELLTTLKKARLHEILERDLTHATKELQELAATSSETSEDEGSYASLKDRAALIASDLSKMSDEKVNKALHGAQDKIKEVAEEAVPPASDDTLKGLDIQAKFF
uniref:Uncharacterized protein n=1 Tax=Coccolithus braarudii TaxID=221442 RepID=A0A7S0L8Y5_9EUKA|mmetsp:Transcript_27134/g.58479  ORF Transcript_27134/g.58479 Transcript_27134/m.58479 type:complete len:289 (+) Transcript_27134:16-882(+)